MIVYKFAGKSSLNRLLHFNLNALSYTDIRYLDTISAWNQNFGDIFYVNSLIVVWKTW